MARQPRAAMIFQHKWSIRSRLFGISIALMVLVGVISGVYLERQLQGWLENRLQSELMRHANTARILLQETRRPSTIQAIDPLADQLGQATAARITIILRSGRVVGDSEQTLQQLRHMENHISRPEVKQALEQDKGISRRHSKTLHQAMLYVAVPFQGSTLRGVVRAAMPMREVAEAITKLRILILLAGALGMILAIFMSALASYLFARMLRRLLQSTQAIAMTASQELPAFPQHHDLEGLAGSINEMARRLEQTVGTLASERNRFEAVLENMNAAVIALDEHQHITLVNRSALSILELEQPPIHQPLSTVVRSQELLSLMSQVQAGEAASTELKLTGPPQCILLVRATPLTTPGSSVMVLHDITELRRLERIRRDFVANVSHELRTPVSIIRANAETLLDGAIHEPELAQEFVEALLRHAEQLSILLSDLLDIARIEANEHKFNPQEVALEPLLRRARQSVEALLHNKALTSSVSADATAMVYADAQAIEQILLNLLSNAIKYTPQHGHIELRTKREEDWIRIEIQDSGPGIAEKHRSRIFERFYRVDKGRSRDMGGTGLGLAIVKHLTETMGGQVGVEPANPHGSIFWLTLPIHPPTDNAEAAHG